jgi:hypothetical protein
MAVSTAPELVILDPDGDAILKVGENPTNQSKDRDEGSSCALQIRISTKLLAMSSKPCLMVDLLKVNSPSVRRILHQLSYRKTILMPF